MAVTHPTTKSIDVGSMFLMDLSVQESETIGDTQNADNDIVFPSNKSIPYPLNEKGRSKTKKNYANLNISNHQQSSIVISNNHHHTSNSKSIAYHRHENRNDYLGNSLDRLASAIQQHDEDHEQQENIGTITTKESPRINMGNIVTTVEPLPPLELVNLNPSSTSASSTSSLSEDDSFVATSSGRQSSSLSDSFGVDDDEDDGGVDAERANSTTREDSGVLDMKNLEGQLNNSYDIDDFSYSNDDHQKQRLLEHKLLHKEKPISTNLINKSAHNNNNNNIFIKRPNKPTKINNNSNHDCSSNSNDNHHYRSQTSSKRSMLMSASLPIQCPPRQMKRDLGKLKKLDLVDEAQAINNDDAQRKQLASGDVQQHDNSQHWNQKDDDDIEADDIWEQDYNLNHKNHYPIDEFDEENLRADTNPQQLFESIKALARSLHKDAELFGSLPPKRLLESPIHRSLAFA